MQFPIIVFSCSLLNFKEMLGFGIYLHMDLDNNILRKDHVSHYTLSINEA